jgi:3'(2'), 5'-bisphosphate nucleotidase
VPVVSEESARELPAAASAYLVVDPLDGTRDFLDGTSEFAVNIALVADGVPVLGVVAAPALGCVWRGGAGFGAERVAANADGKTGASTPIRTRPAPAALVAALSRSHLDAATLALLDTLPVAERRRTGSAVKFGYLAEGTVDVYPRLSPTSEWDIAAGHAIVAAAGGVMTAPDGAPLQYGKTPSFQVPGFVAWGDPEAAARRKAGSA